MVGKETERSHFDTCFSLLHSAVVLRQGNLMVTRHVDLILVLAA